GLLRLVALRIDAVPVVDQDRGGEPLHGAGRAAGHPDRLVDLVVRDRIATREASGRGTFGGAGAGFLRGPVGRGAGRRGRLVAEGARDALRRGRAGCGIDAHLLAADRGRLAV